MASSPYFSNTSQGNLKLPLQWVVFNGEKHTGRATRSLLAAVTHTAVPITDSAPAPSGIKESAHIVNTERLGNVGGSTVPPIQKAPPSPRELGTIPECYARNAIRMKSRTNRPATTQITGCTLFAFFLQVITTQYMMKPPAMPYEIE